MSVEPEYLHSAFAAIRERHGSVDAYLASHLGLTPERREALRDRLLL
jgi:protein-tyrosine phosphatase